MSEARPPVNHTAILMAHGDDASAAFVALGSNLGDRAAFLQAAVDHLAAHPQVQVRRASPVYETRAHTKTSGEVQPDYLNAVVELRTDLTPEALLDVCLRVERAEGRDRSGGSWTPRTLDLDLLLYADLVLDAPGLVLPHPRLPERRFVLQPLADLVPGRPVPGAAGASVADLLERCPDPDVPVRTGIILSVPGG